MSRKREIYWRVISYDAVYYNTIQLTKCFKVSEYPRHTFPDVPHHISPPSLLLVINSFSSIFLSLIKTRIHKSWIWCTQWYNFHVFFTFRPSKPVLLDIQVHCKNYLLIIIKWFSCLILNLLDPKAMNITQNQGHVQRWLWLITLTTSLY